MSKNENKLYTLILYRLQRDGENFSCKITHKEIRDVIKKKSENTYKELAKMLTKLCETRMFFEENTAETQKDTNTYLIGEWSYDKKERVFEIRTFKTMFELLHKKYGKGTGGYTPVDLIPYFNLETKYGRRMYELIRQWSGNKHTLYFTLGEIREALRVGNKYPKTKDLKREVLERAINDLNNLTDENGKNYFKISIKDDVKAGKIVGFNVSFTDNGRRKGDEVVAANVIDFTTHSDKEKTSVSGNTEELKNNTSTTLMPIDNLIVTDMIPQVKKDFKGYNFVSGKYSNVYINAENVTLDITKTQLIGRREYGLFKKILLEGIYSIDRRCREDLI